MPSLDPGIIVLIVVAAVLGCMSVLWLSLVSVSKFRNSIQVHELEDVRIPALALENGIPPLVVRTGSKEWAELDPEVQDLYRRMDQTNTPWKTRYFSDRQSREFLKQHFHARVLQAYDRLIPGAYKADLFRYCAIYMLGGVYVDFTVEFLEPLDTFVDRRTDSLVLCHDSCEVHALVPFFPHNALFNAIFAARPAHPFMWACIERVVHHVETGFYGRNALHPTGPLMFREVWDEYLEAHPSSPHRLEMSHRYLNLLVAHPTSTVPIVQYKHKDHYKFLGPANGAHYSKQWDSKNIYKQASPESPESPE